MPNIHTITAEGPQNSDRKRRVIVVRWCIHLPFMSTNIASIICNIPYWAKNSFPYSSVHRRIVNLNLLLRRSFFFSISFADRSSSPFPSIGLASNGFNFLLQENTCCAMAEVFLQVCTGCFIYNVTNSKRYISGNNACISTKIARYNLRAIRNKILNNRKKSLPRATTVATNLLSKF